MADTDEPFRSYARYLRETYGAGTYRVAVDAGFSCPNRNGGRGSPGCVYCDGTGARAAYLLDRPASGRFDRDVLGEEIQRTLRFLKGRYGAERFILYFQAYTGTNAPVPVLREIYDFALSRGEFRGLVVSTRPDCVDPGKGDLLASYQERGIDVWVELGLQSAHDDTLLRIRRGHTVRDFERAWLILKERGIRCAAHLIFGLPGEGLARILETIRFLNRLDPDGIKIHNLRIPMGTPLAAQYLAGEIVPPCGPRHVEYCVAALEALRAETVVMRLTCDIPASVDAAPASFWKKGRIYDTVRKAMILRNTWQGKKLLL